MLEGLNVHKIELPETQGRNQPDLLKDGVLSINSQTINGKTSVLDGSVVLHARPISPKNSIVTQIPTAIAPNASNDRMIHLTDVIDSTRDPASQKLETFMVEPLPGNLLATTGFVSPDTLPLTPGVQAQLVSKKETGGTILM